MSRGQRLDSPNYIAWAARAALNFKIKRICIQPCLITSGSPKTAGQIASACGTKEMSYNAPAGHAPRGVSEKGSSSSSCISTGGRSGGRYGRDTD